MKKIPIEEVRVSIDSDFCQQCWSAHEYGVSKAHQKAEAYVIHCATTHQQLLDALRREVKAGECTCRYTHPDHQPCPTCQSIKAIEAASLVEVEE
jgi:hypothetical protein